MGERHCGRSAVGAALVAVWIGIAGHVSGASAQERATVRVAKAGAETFAFVPVDIGVELGIFKTHGLDVEISTLVAPKIVQAMAAGSIDIGLSAGTDLALATKAPVKGVAAIAGPPTAFALLVRPDDTVRAVDDLKGRTIGVSANKSLTDWLAARVAISKGWGVKGIATTGIGDTSSRFAALKTRSVDAIVIDIASALQMEQRGEGRILVRFGDLVPKFLTHAIIASDALIAQKPDVVRNFIAAWFETIAYVRSHKPESIAMASRITGVSPEVEAQVYDELVGRPFLLDDGRFDPEAMAVVDAAWLDMGTLATIPPPTSLYTEALLAKP